MAARTGGTFVRVRIVKCPLETYWYAPLVGRTMVVPDSCGNTYLIDDGIRDYLLPKEDCVVVKRGCRGPASLNLGKRGPQATFVPPRKSVDGVVGFLLAMDKYRFADKDLVADVAREAIKMYLE